MRGIRPIWLKGSALLAWMGVIFLLSSMPGSGDVGEPPLWYVIERKSAHVFEFAVLTGLAFLFLKEIFVRETRKRVIEVALAFSVAYGALDELHQAFVFGRGSRLFDVMVDAVGASMMAIALFLIFRTVDHRKEN